MNSKITVKKIEPVDEPVIELNLKLTKRDAVALATACSRIGGLPDSPRGFFNEIMKTLENEGFKYNLGMLTNTSSAIFFKSNFKV